ncbi:MAG: MFS transporter [Rhodospirillales bacterium]|nr:MFS transporter [Rhodospirillales bacterium]
MATIAIAVTMAVLDSAIANIALPTIATDLAASPASSIWVVNAYQLAVTVTLLPLASLGDIIGHRRVYTWGLVVFTLASGACALTHSLSVLVAARVVQGFGGAGIMSVNTALIRFIFPKERLGRGLGFNALVVATSAAIGPSIAALILAVADWHWLFAVNVPLGGIALWLALRVLPMTPRSGHRFDLKSAVLNAITFGLLITAVDGLGDRGHGLIVAIEAVCGIAVGIVFVRRQLSLAAPMLPVDLFRRPIFALSVVTSVCSYTAQGLAYVSLPFFFQNVGGMTPIETGLLMTPWPAIVVIVAPIAGRLSDRYPAGILGGLGLAAMTAGLVSLLLLPAHAAYANVAWRMALCGFGFGFFQSPNNRLLVGSAPRERSGAGSGMLATARLLGQTTGSALVALAFGITARSGGIAAGSTLALAIAVAASGAGMVASTLRLRT